MKELALSPNIAAQTKKIVCCTISKKGWKNF